MIGNIQRRLRRSMRKKEDALPGAVVDPRIPELIDAKTGEFLDAHELAARAFEDIPWRHRTRLSLIEAQHAQQPMWVCAACGVMVRLASSRRKNFFFRHVIEDGRCLFVTRKGLPQDIRAAKYDAAKESHAHIEMKKMIVECLQADNRFLPETIFTETTWKSQEDPSRRRRPDVQAVYEGRFRIAFEVQLSSTLIDEAVSRRDFYLKDGGLLVWIFRNVETQNPRLYQGDILFMNSGNIFVVDDETVEASMRERRLYLKNYHLIPEADGTMIRHSWSPPRLVAFDSLTLDPVKQRVILYDYDAEEEKLRGTMHEELEKDARSHFLEFWRKSEQLQREHQIYKIADQYQDLRQYMEQHSCPMPPDSVFPLGHVAAFIYLMLSAIDGRPVGYNFENNLALWNHAFNYRKELVWYFAVLLSQYNQIPGIIELDRQARTVRPRNRKGERIETFQQKLQEVRNGAVLTENFAGPFSPSRHVAKLASFIFPATPQFKKFATTEIITPKQ
jgi:hypothetical protein